MTSIQGRRRPHWEHISEGLSGSSPPLKSSYDEALANSFAEPPVAKYIKRDLQKIFGTVLKARAPSSDGTCEKPLKTRLPDVYCSKSHIECYNFCQQCEDHFATVGAKSSNHILFAAFFLHDHINFRCQQYKRKHEAECTVSIT